MKNLRNIFTAIVFPASFVAALAIFLFVMGNPANFEGNNSANHPLPGNYLGMIYKGGFVVPILITVLILVLTYSIERFLTISKAAGKGNVETFLSKIKSLLMSGDIDAATAECDAQRGSVGNVLKSGLIKYKEMQVEPNLDKDQKALAIKKEIEEATGLELPALEKNLVVIATIVTLATLLALIGTVLGMIRAFAALAHAGAPDSIALATGISEALINTALGITSSAIAVIAYNFFTAKIDKITYSIDEAGYSILKVFSATSGK